MTNMLVHDVGLIGRSPSGMATNTFDVGYEAGVEDSRVRLRSGHTPARV